MNAADAFSLFSTTYGGVVLAATALFAVAGAYGARRLRISGMPSHGFVMACRTLINVLLFLVALTFLYQAMRIRSLHTDLTELNTPYYEGGQGAAPVASEGELTSLNDLSNRAMVYALMVFLALLLGCGLQYLSERRHRRLATAASSGG